MDILVCDVNYNIDFKFSSKQGIHWFGTSEIVQGLDSLLHVKNSNKKKVVLINWWQYHAIINDLSWADLIICFTTELIHTDWNTFYQNTVEYFGNKNIIFLTGGKLKNDLVPNDIVFSPNLSFLTYVSMSNDNVDYDYTAPRPFIFDAMFGAKKYARIELFNRLVKYNLLDKSLVNLEVGLYSNNIAGPEYRSPELDFLEDDVIKKFRNETKGDLVKSLTSSGVNKFYKSVRAPVWASQVIPINVYKNSWYSIITETNTSRFEFITEKTAKCFYGKRIFICCATEGHLEFLRKQGFKTFNGIIDESYDTEPDLDRRIEMLGQQMVFLSKSDPVKLYEQAKPIIDHNFNLINDMSWNWQRIKDFIQPHLEKLK